MSFAGRTTQTVLVLTPVIATRTVRPVRGVCQCSASHLDTIEVAPPYSNEPRAVEPLGYYRLNKARHITLAMEKLGASLTFRREHLIRLSFIGIGYLVESILQSLGLWVKIVRGITNN